METRIQAVHFDASEHLVEFIEKKVSKLDQYFDGILTAEVTLKVVKPETVNNKEVITLVDRETNLIQFRDDLASTTIYQYDDAPSSFAFKTDGVDDRDGRHVLSDAALRKMYDSKRDDDSSFVDRRSDHSYENTHYSGTSRLGDHSDDSSRNHDPSCDKSSHEDRIHGDSNDIYDSHHGADHNRGNLDIQDSHGHDHFGRSSEDGNVDSDRGNNNTPHAGHENSHHHHYIHHNGHHLKHADSFISPHDILHIADNILLNAEVIIMELDALLSTEELEIISSSTDSFQNPLGYSMSGRIGEQLAYEYLSSFIAKDVSWKERVIDIKWMNRDKESGGPYDILITLTSGEMKYCEVKTRLVRRTMTDSDLEPVGLQLQTQWPISPYEISEAVHRNTSYCCMLLNIDIDQIQNSVQVLSVRMVGFMGGLVHSIYSNQANLLIQIT